LRFSEKHFQGYWLRLNTLIRSEEDADELLDGILTFPMSEIIDIMGNAQHANHGHAQAVLILYRQNDLGDPPGTYPNAEQLDRDPIRAIRDFALATDGGRNGGLNPATGRLWAQSRTWARAIFNGNLDYRSACKHIWETIVATLSAEEAVTIIAGLPYGSGPKLLAQVKNMQQRQTTMALFTLFNSLISMYLRSGERIAGLHGRILAVRARLENWDPPIILPDKLLIVCMLRMLPRQFHATRTIIMSRETITLDGSRDMLLDCENQDSARITAAVGSKQTLKPQPHATALLTNTSGGKHKKKKKKRPNAKDDPKKSAKYKSEGPCSYHGSKCKHASSECHFLHPELKPTAAVADEAEALAASAATSTNAPAPFGFMNQEWGYASIAEPCELLGEEVKVLVGVLSAGVCHGACWAHAF